ncbi:hypothetical protein MLD38_028691 [Melastoma candidum]|uniref:Uncharacterized protein n=1 Tax=Melastoma candidum TaxID=119954 RepID=A0ACB9N3D2_9MYRT|nr:hypothetical protein MLD38_028691 [Melastoma candidum]
MDIGEIRPSSSNGDSYILVAIDYFAKWVEAKAYKNITQSEVIEFLRSSLIYRFGIAQNVVVDNAIVFNGSLIKDFAAEFGFVLTNSSPYYAQSNGQAELTNKIIKNAVQKMIDDNPRSWHTLLLDVLWALRVTKRESIEQTPCNLVYGHDAILLIEVRHKSRRFLAHQENNHIDYEESMYIELENLDAVHQIRKSLNRIQVQKERAARSYNKRVVLKSFKK